MDSSIKKVKISKSDSDSSKEKEIENIINATNQDEETESPWWSLPDLVLSKIFCLLPVKDILNAGCVCRRWYEIANDELLWKKKFQQNFKVDAGIALKPGSESWKNEYERLTVHIPFIQTQCLKGHVHQVLHISFAHNGEMFATCSKDGYVIIWNSLHPCVEKYSHNMKDLNWKYTQYSQFNQSDTLLLVSGVHFGSPHSTLGEIAVYTIDPEYGSYLCCRVVNRPYDIFGTWFSDQYLISGDLNWLAHMVSTSILWLNKANQEIGSEHIPVMSELYRFYNRNASSVRAIMMAKCPWLDEVNDPLALDEFTDENKEQNETDIRATANTPNTANNSAGNPLSHLASLRRAFQVSFDESVPSTSNAALCKDQRNGNDATIHYLDEYRRSCIGDTVSNESTDEDDKYDDLESSLPKCLIFSTGSKTYTPHQIAIKRIRNVDFPKKLDPGPSLKERIAAKKAAKHQDQTPDPDWWNYEAVADRFDKVDKIIDLHGHIIGMALSPDHRYLYVNTRPWPKNYVITNPLEPPPIAQEIDIHVIDLMTLKRVGNMLRAHKAYTPSTECFFIFLDVCDDYVASGAEDMHAYLWDRYYGISLAKYKHADVVNSVAFNPKDSEMLVTTSDDFTIKIWRSRAKVKACNIEIDPTRSNEAFYLKGTTDC